MLLRRVASSQNRCTGDCASRIRTPIPATLKAPTNATYGAASVIITAENLLPVAICCLQGETKQRWQRLCEQAATEQDPQVVMAFDRRNQPPARREREAVTSRASKRAKCSLTRSPAEMSATPQISKRVRVLSASADP